jgi:hypothetical protein
VMASANLPWRIRGGIDHAGGRHFATFRSSATTYRLKL